MKQKLQQILLIDDSHSDNFIHERRIRNMNVTEKVVTKYNGREAIDYLNTALSEDIYPAPDLIFLDINMPVMDGWKFLEEYEQLPDEKKARIVLAMLTTSTADQDKERAEKFHQLSKFITKPLTEQDLRVILDEHFPELVLAEEE